MTKNNKSNNKVVLNEGLFKSFFGLFGAGIVGYILGKKSNINVQSGNPKDIKKVEQMLKKNKNKVRKLRKNTKEFKDLVKALEQGKIKNPKDWEKYAGWTGIKFE